LGTRSYSVRRRSATSRDCVAASNLDSLQRGFENPRLITGVGDKKEIAVTESAEPERPRDAEEARSAVAQNLS
jgi:hypothetical protein